MRKWIDLVEADSEWLDSMYDDFNWDKLFHNVETEHFILRTGYELFHATSGDWNPEEIDSPAWFGDYNLALGYGNNVFGYSNTRVYKYITTRDYRLLLLDPSSEIMARMRLLMDGGDILMKDMALAVIDQGWDGWYEPDGEIMLGDPSGLKFLGVIEGGLT